MVLVLIECNIDTPVVLKIMNLLSSLNMHSCGINTQPFFLGANCSFLGDCIAQVSAIDTFYLQRYHKYLVGDVS